MIASSLLRLFPPGLAERLYYRFLCGRYGDSATRIERVSALRGRPAVKMTVVEGDVISDAIYWTGLYEARATRAIRKMASEDGGLLVDVGANIGYFTLIWLSCHELNRVVAIEASPDNLGLLTKNLQINELDNRCRLVEVAASSASGKTSFDLGPRQQTGWGGISEGVGSGSRVIHVHTERIDRLVDSTEQVRLLKVDVEGAEALVLGGASELLERRQVQEVWFEDNVARREALGITAHRLTATLIQHGYHIVDAQDHANLPMDIVAYAPK